MRAREIDAGILLSMHNIYFLLDLMRRAREAIIEGRYQHFLDEWMALPCAQDERMRDYRMRLPFQQPK